MRSTSRSAATFERRAFVGGWFLRVIEAGLDQGASGLGGEHIHRRGVDHALDVACLGRLQQVGGAAAIDTIEDPGIGGPLLGHPGAVEDPANAIERGLDGCTVRHVARHQLDAIEQLPSALDAAHQRAHVVAALDQQPRQPIPDEPGPAGHQHFRHARCRPGHGIGPAPARAAQFIFVGQPNSRSTTPLVSAWIVLQLPGHRKIFVGTTGSS
jgi:hypothetical protein